MVEAGAKEVTEAQVVGALEAAHAAIKQLIAAIDDLKAVDRQEEAGSRRQGRSRRSSIARSRTRRCSRSTDAMRIKQKLESYAQVDAVLENLLASIPEDEKQERADAEHIFHELQEKAMKVEALEHGVRLDGRKFDEIRPIWTETGVLPARPRLRRLHARRDAGARQLHARHRRRSAEDRARHRRALQALHAPLQLPAVLGWRDRTAARTGPPRDRPRRPRRARARAGRSRAKRSSPTPSASSPTSSSRTVPRRWPRSAAARWR